MKNIYKNFFKSEIRLYLLALLLTLIFFWKIYPVFFEALPYTHQPAKGYEEVTNFQGDHLQWLYHLALPQKAIQGKIKLFSEGFQFMTPYKTEYINLHFPPAGIIYLIFSPLGLAGAYNMTMIFFLFLSIIATFKMLKDFTFSSESSLAGALIYSFAPYKISVMTGGHPAGMLLSLLPLLIFLLNRMINNPGKIIYSFSSGLILICLAASEPHYHYYSFLFSPIIYLYLKLNSVFNKSFQNPFYQLDYKKLLYPLPPKITAFVSLVIFQTIYFQRHEAHLLLILPISLTILFLLIVFDHILHNITGKRSCFFSFAILNFYALQLIFNIPLMAPALSIIAMLLFLKSYLPAFFKLCLRQSIAELKNLKGYLPFLSGALISIIYMIHVKSANYNSSGIKTGRTLDEISLYSPHIKDIFNFHAISSSHYVFPGFVVAILFFAALFIIFKKLFTAKELSKNFYLGASSLVLFFFFYILSFGPNFPILPLFNFLRKTVPYFSFIRSPIKIIPLAFLALSVVFASILKARKAALTVIIMIILEALVLYSNYGVCFLNKDNPAFTDIQKGNGKVLYLPIWPGNSSWESLYQLYSLYTDRDMINGYQPAVSGAYITNVADKLYPLNLGIITDIEYKLLNELKVDTIVFNKEAFPRKVSPFPQQYTLNNLNSSPYLKLLSFHDPLAVFSVEKSNAEQSLHLPPFATGFLIEAEHASLSPQGTVVKGNNQASFHHEVKADKDAVISFQKHFPKGSYNLTISLTASEKVSCLLEITDKDNSVLKKKITADSAVNIKFKQKKNLALLNFKIRVLNKSALFDFFYIEHSSLPPVEDVLPGQGIYTGEIIKDNGKDIIKTDGKYYNKGPAFFAPNRLLAAGNYLASFHFKYKKESTGNLHFAVTGAHGIFSHKNKTLKPEDITGDWQKVSLSFTLEKENVINLLAEFPGKGILYIKKFEIKKDEQ